MTTKAWNELVDFLECVTGTLLMVALITVIYVLIYMIGARP